MEKKEERRVINQGIISDDWKPSKEIIESIKEYEGFRNRIYLDGNDVPTIGYGETDPAILKKYKNKRITKKEAEKYLLEHVDEVVGQLKHSVSTFNKLTNNQKDALLHYTYNVGIGNLTNKSPKLMKALNEGNWQEAAKQMDFGYYDKVNTGLQDRRNMEQELFLKDFYVVPTREELMNEIVEDIIHSKNAIELQDPYVTSRGEAFREARKRGDKTFMWDGKEYSTRIKEDGGYIASRDNTSVGNPPINENAKNITPTSQVNVSEIVAGGIPVIGDIMDVKDFVRATKDLDAAGMIASALGLIPVFGGAMKSAANITRLPKNLSKRDMELLESMPEYAHPNSPAGEAWLNHKKRLLSGAYERLVGEPLELVDGKINPSQIDTRIYNANDPEIFEQARYFSGSETPEETKEFLNNIWGIIEMDGKMVKGNMDQFYEAITREGGLTKEEIDNIIKSHEVEHLVHFPVGKPDNKTFSVKDAVESAKEFTDEEKEELRRYFTESSGTELAARGTQIKDYFGLTDDSQEVTPEMLEYAAKHYIEDYGMDNTMEQFFAGIKDYKKMADWINHNASVGLGVYFINKAGEKVTEEELEAKKNGGKVIDNHIWGMVNGKMKMGKNAHKRTNHKFYLYGGRIMEDISKKPDGGPTFESLARNAKDRFTYNGTDFIVREVEGDPWMVQDNTQVGFRWTPDMASEIGNLIPYDAGVLPEIRITADLSPEEYRNAMRKADARRGRHAVYAGQNKSKLLMLGLAGAAAAASFAGVPSLYRVINTASDAAQIVNNPYDPSNYIGFLDMVKYTKKLPHNPVVIKEGDRGIIKSNKEGVDFEVSGSNEIAEKARSEFKENVVPIYEKMIERAIETLPERDREIYNKIKDMNSTIAAEAKLIETRSASIYEKQRPLEILRMKLTLGNMKKNVDDPSLFSFSIRNDLPKGTGGLYSDASDEVFINRDVLETGEENLIETLVHEYRHKFDPREYNMAGMMERDVKDRLLMGEQEYEMIDYAYQTFNGGYPGKLQEKVATNSQLRNHLKHMAEYKGYDRSVEEYIDEMSDKDLVESLSGISYYGKEYANYINSIPEVEKEYVIGALRNSLKYIPLMLPTAIELRDPMFNQETKSGSEEEQNTNKKDGGVITEKPKPNLSDKPYAKYIIGGKYQWDGNPYPIIETMEEMFQKGDYPVMFLANTRVNDREPISMEEAAKELENMDANELYDMMLDTRDEEILSIARDAMKDYGGLDVIDTLNGDGKHGLSMAIREQVDLHHYNKMQGGGEMTKEEEKEYEKIANMSREDAIIYLTQQQAFRRMTQAGIQPIQAIAIIGNLMGESRMNPYAEGDSGRSYGIQQWHKERKDKLFDFARRRGHSEPDFGDQIDFLIDEFQNDRSFLFSKNGKNQSGYYNYSKADFLNADTLFDAVVAWNQGVGRPHVKALRNLERYKYAIEAANNIGYDIGVQGKSTYGIQGMEDKGFFPVNAIDEFAKGTKDELLKLGVLQEEEKSVPGDGVSGIVQDPAIEEMPDEERKQKWFETYGEQILTDAMSKIEGMNAAVREENMRAAAIQAINREKEIQKQKERELIAAVLPNIGLNIPGMAKG